MRITLIITCENYIFISSRLLALITISTHVILSHAARPLHSYAAAHVIRLRGAGADDERHYKMMPPSLGSLDGAHARTVRQQAVVTVIK